MLARKSPLKRTGPIRARRRSAYKPAKVRFHLNRVAAMGCLVSGKPATLHHVTASIHGGRITRTDRCVVPLAPEFHQKVHDPLASDPISVEGLGHRGFYEKYGMDLEAIGNALWAESEALWEAKHGRGVVNA